MHRPSRGGCCGRRRVELEDAIHAAADIRRDDFHPPADVGSAVVRFTTCSVLDGVDRRRVREERHRRERDDGKEQKSNNEPGAERHPRLAARTREGFRAIPAVAEEHSTRASNHTIRRARRRPTNRRKFDRIWSMEVRAGHRSISPRRRDVDQFPFDPDAVRCSPIGRGTALSGSRGRRLLGGNRSHRGPRPEEGSCSQRRDDELGRHRTHATILLLVAISVCGVWLEVSLARQPLTTGARRIPDPGSRTPGSRPADPGPWTPDPD